MKSKEGLTNGLTRIEEKGGYLPPGKLHIFHEALK